MGSILREILMGEVRVLAGGDPEKIAKECADKIMEALGLRPVRMKRVHPVPVQEIRTRKMGTR